MSRPIDQRKAIQKNAFGTRPEAVDKPDTSVGHFENDETDEDAAAREARRKAREEMADRDNSTSHYGDAPGTVKKTLLKKLAPDMGEAKSMDPEAAPTSAPDRSAGDMPAERRIKVKQPKPSGDLW